MLWRPAMVRQQQRRRFQERSPAQAVDTRSPLQAGLRPFGNYPLEASGVDRCTPARTHDERQLGSCGIQLETVLVVQSAEDWRRGDAMTSRI